MRQQQRSPGKGFVPGPPCYAGALTITGGIIVAAEKLSNDCSNRGLARTHRKSRGLDELYLQIHTKPIGDRRQQLPTP